MKYMLTVIFCWIKVIAFANDGVFTMNGNHLVPIKETQISVQKEVLTLTKRNDNQLLVDVYYEFYNPGKTKEVLVGFEAEPPSGDFSVGNDMAKHPYMYDFSVDLNNKHIPYKVNVTPSLKKFGINHKDTLSYKKIKELYDNNNLYGVVYVYYFKATFKPGKNIVKHKYRFEMSGSVEMDYTFDYILSAAGRWANKQIDDFTLIVNMGAMADFCLVQNFYTSRDEWMLGGIGKSIKGKMPSYAEDKSLSCDQFFIQNGKMTFHKLNFKPNAELMLFAKRYIHTESYFNYKEHVLPFGAFPYFEDVTHQDALSRKILRNLPFAKRGYIFQDKEVQAYYQSLEWYMANANYKAELEMLTDKEKEWYAFWK